MSLKLVGDVAGKVLKQVQEKISGRGPMSAWARRMARHSRQNWRHNGLRPRGRGYDWARTLIAEKLLEHATLAQLEQNEAAASCAVVEVKMAELAAAVGCHVRIARREVARLESMGCLARAGRRGGRGCGTVLHVYHKPLAARVLGRLHRFDGAKTGRGPQLALPLKRVVEVPADIQASIDRMAAIAAARARGDGAREAREGRYLETGRFNSGSRNPSAGGETVDKSAQNFLREKTDPSPSHTLPQPSRTSPSALASASGEGGLRRREIKFAKIVQRPDLKTLELDWRECDFTDRASKEALSEALRRRLLRHLRLCCWYRGLGLVETRRVTGAVGWTAVGIGKALKRKYLLMDAIGWVMASKPDELRQATASWTRMLGRARSGFERRPDSQVKHSI